MTSHPSPLGRYGDDSADEQLHEVHLLRVPLRVMVAGREHHSGLMREFALLALAEDSHRSHLPARLVELTEILGVRYGKATARPSAVIEAALAEGKDTVDVTYQVPLHVVEAAETLDALMAEADEFCLAEQLLTLKREQVVADFATWYLDEFRRQVNGLPPTPWPGPLDVG
ncbi:MAG: hypothetical protein JWN31_353 [Frankiales bacterium]|nr:hypothetical protein [Frankiales bacterium]